MLNKKFLLSNTPLEGTTNILSKRYIQNPFVNEIESEFSIVTKKIKIPPEFANTNQLLDYLYNAVDVEDRAFQNHLSQHSLIDQSEDLVKPNYLIKKPTVAQGAYYFTTPKYQATSNNSIPKYQASNNSSLNPDTKINLLDNEDKKDFHRTPPQEDIGNQKTTIEHVNFLRNGSIIRTDRTTTIYLNLNEIDPFDENYSNFLFRANTINDGASHDFTLTPLAVALIIAEILACLVCCCLLYNFCTCLRHKWKYNKEINREMKRKCKVNGQMKTQKVLEKFCTKDGNDFCV